MGEETIKIEDGEIRLRGRLKISWGGRQNTVETICAILLYTQITFTCSKSAIETLEKRGICSKLTPFSSVSISLKK